MNRVKPSAPIQKALEKFADALDGRLRAHLNSCVHCGLCAEVCHYYQVTKDDADMPATKVEQLSRVFKRYRTLAGRIIPRWIGADNFDQKAVEEMLDVVFGRCTMCGRCALHCSIGVDIPFLVRTSRSMLVELGLVPPGLQSTVDAAVQTGNNMAIPREELVDTLEWLEEELRIDVEDENARIPLDQRGAKVLYTLNPREPKFFPLSISAISKIFHAAGESWTISTNVYDVTNYAYFSGGDDEARTLTRRLFDETLNLEAETLALAECGHGYRAIRWEGPDWIEKRYPFKVISIIELLADYIRSGKIRVDSSRNEKPVTLHDPCNLVRNGGVMQEQRYVLTNVAKHFIEMVPNRENNYCCGGGGGQLSMGEYKERRIAAGRVKADQICKTGAKIVATPCHNCIDQLMELNQVYKLDVEIKTIAEIAADAVLL